MSIKYSCYECNKKGFYTELSSDINKRFITEDGRCLCDKCSIGEERASEKHIQIIKENSK